MNVSIEKVAPPVAFVLVGLSMILIGSSGVVPINPYPEITSPTIKNLLIVLGVIFLILGPFFLWLEIKKEKDASQSHTAKNNLNIPRLKKKQGEIEQDNLVDPKLVHFTPPFKPNQFSIINIPRPDPIKSSYLYKFAPFGILATNNIPFFLLPVEDNFGNPMGHLTVQVQPPPNNIVASIEKFDANCNNIYQAHFLISAGHGWRLRDGIQILNKRIGYIRFEFSDNTNQTFQLIIGKHLREWSFGNNPNLITEIDLNWAKPAWLSHDGTKRIDILTIPIQNGPKDIKQIEIGAQFDEDPKGNIKDPPVIIISAITFERKI